MGERSFVMVKPDGVGRRLVGEIIGRYESKGLKLVALSQRILSEETAKAHYAEHAEKPFFGELVSFITSGPTVQMVWEGTNAVEVIRGMNGATNAIKAAPGTIRGDLGLSMQNNVVHASDSVETAGEEIALYFSQDQVLDYEMPDGKWLQ